MTDEDSVPSQEINMKRTICQIQGFLQEHLDCYAVVGYTCDKSERVLVMMFANDQQRDAITELLRMAASAAGDVIEQQEEDEEMPNN